MFMFHLVTQITTNLTFGGVQDRRISFTDKHGRESADVCLSIGFSYANLRIPLDVMMSLL